MEGRFKKEKGSIGDMLAAGICMLAMTVLMLSYMKNAELIFQKAAVSQVARKYMLRMETVGMLTNADQTTLLQELQEIGLTEVSLEGTSDEVGYGEAITLQIRGKLGEENEILERKVSTAKNGTGAD